MKYPLPQAQWRTSYKNLEIQYKSISSTPLIRPTDSGVKPRHNTAVCEKKLAALRTCQLLEAHLADITPSACSWVGSERPVSHQHAFSILSQITICDSHCLQSEESIYLYKYI